MGRPQRIEFEGAVYHVMNRGRGRAKIFHGDDYYFEFFNVLEEAYSRFDLRIHAYCLMATKYIGIKLYAL